MKLRAVGMLTLGLSLTGCMEGPKPNIGQPPVEDAVPETGEGVLTSQTALGAYERGEVHRARGEFDEAIDEFSEAIRLDPIYADAFGNRGICYAGIGEFDKADDDFSEVLRLDPSDINALGNRGIAFTEKGEYDKALDDFHAVIRSDPRDALGYYNRASAYYGKAQYGRAFDDYRAATLLSPDDADFGLAGDNHGQRVLFDQATLVEVILHREASSQQAHCSQSVISDPPCRSVGNMQEGDRDPLLDLIGCSPRTLLHLLCEDWLAVHRNGMDDFPFVIIQRRQRPGLCQLDGHLEQFPVTGRDHGVGW